MIRTSALLRQVIEDVDYLIESWPSVVTLSTPGSTRRPTPRHVSDAQRSHRALLALQERMEDARRARELGVEQVPPTGPIPAPAPLAVLDLLADYAAVSADVADAIAQTVGVEREPAVESAWTDPRPHLRLVREWVRYADEVDDRTLPWVRSRLGPLAERVAAQLGEIHDGQVLDALCPWCGGRTERRPNGGDRTLVVYARGSRLEQVERAGDGAVIVCRGVNCEPPLGACGTRVGQHPAWPEREWDWLAKRLLPTSA